MLIILVPYPQASTTRPLDKNKLILIQTIWLIKPVFYAVSPPVSRAVHQRRVYRDATQSLSWPIRVGLLVMTHRISSYRHTATCSELTHWSLATPYDVVDLGQHRFAYWLVWRHQTIPEPMLAFEVDSPHKGLVKRSFGIFFAVNRNLLNKQSSTGDLQRHDSIVTSL